MMVGVDEGWDGHGVVPGASGTFTEGLYPVVVWCSGKKSLACAESILLLATGLTGPSVSRAPATLQRLLSSCEERSDYLRCSFDGAFLDLLGGQAAYWMLDQSERVVGYSAEVCHCPCTRFKRFRADGYRRYAQGFELQRVVHTGRRATSSVAVCQ